MCLLINIWIRISKFKNARSNKKFLQNIFLSFERAYFARVDIRERILIGKRTKTGHFRLHLLFEFSIFTKHGASYSHPLLNDFNSVSFNNWIKFTAWLHELFESKPGVFTDNQKHIVRRGDVENNNGEYSETAPKFGDDCRCCFAVFNYLVMLHRVILRSTC